MLLPMHSVVPVYVQFSPAYDGAAVALTNTFLHGAACARDFCENWENHDHDLELRMR